MTLQICVLCDRYVTERERSSSYRKISGFVRRRTVGGTNHVRRMTETGESAHRECVETNRIPGQEAML